MCPLETPPGGDREQTDEWVEEITGGGWPNTHFHVSQWNHYEDGTPLQLTRTTGCYQTE